MSRKKIYRLLTVLLALFLTGCETGLRLIPPDRKDSLLPPRFTFAIINSPSEDGTLSEGSFTADLRYDDLVFVKTDSGYLAHYQISLNIFSDEKLTHLSYSKIFEKHILVRNYSQTNSTTLFDKTEGMITLSPQVYYVVVKLYDFNTGYSSERIIKHTFKDYSKDRIAISDIKLFYMSDSVSSTKGASNIESNVAIIRNRFRTLYTGFAIVSRDTTLPIILKITAISNESPTKLDTTLSLQQNVLVRAYKLGLKMSGLAPGSYTLKITAKLGNSESSSKTSFFIERGRIPTVPAELDQELGPLRYIATDAEIDSLMSGTFPDRQKKFLEFWIEQAHGDTIVADAMRNEFYKRVDFANERFRYSITPGWKTDRGRIYIIYGPPDQVDDNNQSFNSPPYQIWYYYSLKLRFVFLDEFRVGDYRLVETSRI
ncbi:MAG: GWxTD domain-containing protein [Candidatus Kryptoniota bacterium]